MFIFIHVCTESESFSTSSENGEGEFGTDRISGHLSPIHTDYCPQKQGGGGESQSSNKSIIPWYSTPIQPNYGRKKFLENCVCPFIILFVHVYVSLKMQDYGYV